MLRDDAKILGVGLTLLMLPALIYRYTKGIPVTPEYYPPKAEAFERNELSAWCGFCNSFRDHVEVIWLMPYTETRECLTCGTLVEL